MITRGEVLDRLNYDPASGEFTYRIAVSQMKPGDIAGRPNTNGHIQISICYKRYMAHNLAWLVMTGELPTFFVVDHKDRNYSNNAWCNLRAATHSQNCGNTKVYKNNKSGFKGVYYHSTKHLWVAQLRGHLGYFNTAKQANEAYKEAALKYFGEFSK